MSEGTLVQGDNCPGGTVVLGGHLSGGTVVQGDNCPGGQMSGGHLSGGQISHHRFFVPQLGRNVKLIEITRCANEEMF